MLILSINEGINASIVLMEDHTPIFALQEERVVKQKEFVGFPEQAIAFAFEYLKLTQNDIDIVCFSNLNSPNFRHEDFLKSYQNSENTVVQSLLRGNFKAAARRAYHYVGWLRKMRIQAAAGKSNARVDLRLKSLGLAHLPLMRTGHHLNHAASAYYGLRTSDEPHLVLTLDGGGDGDCANVYIGENGHLRNIARTEAGHSLGQIYSRITYLLGMKPHEHEYKLMGMAPYADANYAQPVVSALKSYLGFDPNNPMCFKRKVAESTEFIHARMERDLRRIRFDSIAGGVQTFTEDLLLEWVANCMKATGIRRVLGAGGVFMNVKANKLVSTLDGIESFDVFPSCGDETLPFGAAWLAAKNNKISVPPGSLKTMYLGPDGAFDLDDLSKIDLANIKYEKINDPISRTVELVASGEIVARCSGGMEFGARALGNRSLLADPMQPNIIPTINKMIKKRDFWMPFAPVVLAEHASRYVRIPNSLQRDHISPYMMHSFATTERADEMAAAVHPYDNSARAQIVSEDINPDLHQIIQGFHSRTGRSVLLNTSFNLHGLPIVMGVLDAIHVMKHSEIKHLMVNDHYFYKS